MNDERIQQLYSSFHKKVVLVLMGVISLMLTSEAQGQSAELIVNPDSIAPGMQSNVILKVTAPRNSRIVFPVLNDTLTADIEIVSYGNIDTLEVNESVVYTRDYQVTAWQEGFFVIPPVLFEAIDEGDTLLLESNPSLLEVSPVEVDMDAGLKDIRPIFRVPVTFWELLPYILALFVVLGSAFLIYRMIKKRNRKEQKNDIWEKPDIPAHVAALSSLEKLRSQKLWQNGKIKQYHTELTFILRMYVGKRYHMNAPEMTSSEIISKLETHIKNNDILSIVKGILEQADLVKFARHVPGASENEAALEMAIEFVKYNIPEQEEYSGNKEISNLQNSELTRDEIEGQLHGNKGDQQWKK
ncbi:MAG: hypothetical protein R6U64_02160 [Bacteroidales bacterium]